MRKLAVALVMGSLFALLLVLMRSAPLSSENIEIDPELLTLACVEGAGCTATLMDASLEEEIILDAEDLYLIARHWEDSWEEDKRSAEPLSIAGLYLLIAPEVPSAYDRYNSFVRELLESDPKNQELYELVFTMTWEHWALTESPSIRPALDMLYASGADRVREAGFDSSQRYQSDLAKGEMSEDPYDCVGLSDQIVTLAILGHTIGARDRGLWQMHAGDAAMACSSCQGVLAQSYNPALAWAFYDQAGLEEDARATALYIGHTSLAAAMMVEVDGLNPCQEEFVTGLQAERSSSALVGDAIIWFLQGGMPSDEVILLLEASAQAAEKQGRPDVSASIRSYIEQTQPDQRYSTPDTIYRRKPGVVDL